MPKKNKKKEDRFLAAETRPQFQQPHKTSTTKVVLDDRFASVLTDPRFSVVSSSQDKRGKKKKKVKEELSAFYTVVDKPDENEKKKHPKKDDPVDDQSNDDSSTSTSSSSSSSQNDDRDDDAPEDPASRIAYLTALSRGELAMSSSSEDDDDDDSDASSQASIEDDDEDGEDPVYGTAGVLDPSNKEEEEERIEISYDDSPYLVATQLDWENLRAVDIFAILSSFVPPGAIQKVQVFQSDFGRERMAQDKLHGPSDIWRRKKAKKKSQAQVSDDDASDDESQNSSDDEGPENEPDDDESVPSDASHEASPPVTYDESDFDPEKLRAYEASKLKYFFAIVKFAKSEHANIAYREVDGLEFEL